MPLKPAARQTIAVGALVLLGLAMSACGGGSSNDATPNPSPTDSPSQFGAAQNKCTADVAVTGAVKVSWKGDAQVVIAPSGQGSGPDASYFSVDGKNQLSVYSSGTDFPTSVTLAIGKTAYSSAGQDAPTGLDASSDGTKATVDLDLADVDGKTAHVTATYACGKKAIKPTYTHKSPKKPGKKG